MIYTWKNKKTGEIAEVTRSLEDYKVPPTWDNPTDWERTFSFATKIEGGTTPARGSSHYGRKI